MSSVLRALHEAIESNAVPGACAGVYRVGAGGALIEAAGRVGGPDSDEVTPETMYDLASVTKLYTAALVFRAHLDGHLDLEHRVGRYLEVFRESDLRVADLLSHRAGFGVRLGAVRAEHREAFAQAVFQIPPPRSAAPGCHYENITFLYLGNLLEEVRGDPLAEQARELLNELGLRRTAPRVTRGWLHPTPPTEVVDGSVFAAATHDESARLLGGFAGNAGMFADITDLVSFGRAWIEGRVVPRAFLEESVTPDRSGGEGERRMGLAWWRDLPGVLGADEHGWLCHPGYTGFLLAIHLDDGLVVAVTCNRTYLGRDNQRHRALWTEVLRSARW